MSYIVKYILGLALLVSCDAQECSLRFSDWGVFAFERTAVLTNTTVACGRGNAIGSIVFHRPPEVPEYGRLQYTCRYMGDVKFNCSNRFTPVVPVSEADIRHGNLHIKQKAKCITDQGFMERFSMQFIGGGVRYEIRCCTNPKWKFRCSEKKFTTTSLTPRPSECTGREYINEWEQEANIPTQIEQEHKCCVLTN